MKIVVTNLSGNTGKSTVANNMLVPLLGAELFPIEDINAGAGVGVQVYTAAAFEEVAAKLFMMDDDKHAVIDAGSSNIKDLLEHFDELRFTSDSIDYWVIPVVAGEKQQIDSVNTVLALRKVGIPFEKIVMILSNVDDVHFLERTFASIFELRKLGVNVVDSPILNNEVFQLIKNHPDCLNVIDVARNPPDFAKLKEEVKKSGDKAAILALGVRQVIQQKALRTAQNLQEVFEASPMFQPS